jgi:predicted esterase
MIGVSRPILSCITILALLACSRLVPLPASDRPASPPVPLDVPVLATPPLAPAAAPPPPEPAPLHADGPFVDLSVEGFAPAVVSLPLGARTRRPVVVATHGNYDRPEWQCEVWREIVGDRAFVLCPRGVARRDSPSREDVRFTYENNRALERETLAALAALRARYPDRADTEQPIYTGFSLGAFMGASIAVRQPAELPRLVLTEGGHDAWTADAAAAFAKGGGERVLFVCSQPACGNEADQAAKRLARAGVTVRVVRGPNAGHRYDGPTAEATRGALGWVLEGDTRWDEAR